MLRKIAPHLNAPAHIAALTHAFVGIATSLAHRLTHTVRGARRSRMHVLNALRHMLAHATQGITTSLVSLCRSTRTNRDFDEFITIS